MAADTTWADDRRISIGRVFSLAFDVMRGNPVAVFGISFLFGALPGVLINIFIRRTSLELIRSGAQSSVLAISIGSALIAFALSMLVQGALVRATVAHAEGERAGFGQSVTAGLSVALPLFVLSILIALGVGIGFVLLIVPGIMLYIRWSVAAPALVEERKGIFEALTRSQYLTRGAGWTIFGLFLVALAITWIISAIAGVAMVVSAGDIAQLASGDLPMGMLILSAVLSTLTSSFWATMQTALYVELRSWKDGPEAEKLAEVFA